MDRTVEEAIRRKVTSKQPSAVIFSDLLSWAKFYNEGGRFVLSSLDLRWCVAWILNLHNSGTTQMRNSEKREGKRDHLTSDMMINQQDPSSDVTCISSFLMDTPLLCDLKVWTS